jgi:hypothetical protein
MVLRWLFQGWRKPASSGCGLAETAAQRPDGILLRAARQPKVMLDQTFTDMAAAQENWDDMDLSSADGLSNLVW